MFFREKNTKYMSKVLKYGLFVCLDILEINTYKYYEWYVWMIGLQEVLHFFFVILNDLFK